MPGIRFDVADGIGHVVLDDLERRNALSDSTLDALIDGVRDYAGDAAVGAIVVRSADEGIFSAGGDLDRFRGTVDVVAQYDAVGRYPKLFEAFWHCGKPTLCAVDGLALGGSVGLILACDLVLAAESAQFGIPELDIGLFPYFTAALLHRNVALKHANELLLLGQRISAAHAAQLGIVNRVVERSQLPATTDDWARRLAARPATAVRLGKTAMYDTLGMPVEQALEHMRHALALALASEDLKDGIAALDARRAARGGART